jgi:hypothetical protein
LERSSLQWLDQLLQDTVNIAWVYLQQTGEFTLVQAVLDLVPELKAVVLPTRSVRTAHGGE